MTTIEINDSAKPSKGIKELTVLDKSISSNGLIYTLLLVDIDGQIWNGRILLIDENVEWKSLTNITPKL